RSFICAPMISKGKPMGVLYVRSFAPGKFNTEDLQSVSALANQAAVAIENAHLFAGVAEGRDKFQAILNSTNDGILMFDTATRIVTANPRLEEMWDLSRAGLEGRTLIELLDQTDFQIAGKIGYTPEVLRALLEQVRAGQRTEWPREVYSLPGSTRQHYIERTGLPVLDASNRLIGWMLVLHDVSEEHELQQLRDDLTNMIIHDLRSPLSSVLGSLQLLDEMIKPRNPAAPERQALTIATRSTRKLLDLVNSLLDISKLTSGQVMIETAPADLSSVIDLAIERLSSLASESSIIIRKQIAGNLPIVLIDEDKISRVLINLLDNALKYTPTDGRITILAERWPTNDRQRPMVCCTVRDTGPGIPPEFRDSVFERFVQVTGQTGRRRGTGLGLSFCKLAVEAHGGKIWASDGPGGNGSDFSFTLPATDERGFGMDD
ncbi:MAG TPA: ATP-binding protein, partial [Anaerolineae bacterium]